MVAEDYHRANFSAYSVVTSSANQYLWWWWGHSTPRSVGQPEVPGAQQMPWGLGLSLTGQDTFTVSHNTGNAWGCNRTSSKYSSTFTSIEVKPNAIGIDHLPLHHSVGKLHRSLGNSSLPSLSCTLSVQLGWSTHNWQFNFPLPLPPPFPQP